MAGSFSHLDFPAAKSEGRWYTPLRAAINEKSYFIKEDKQFFDDDSEFPFNQDGRPNELYFGFKDILKHDSIWNDKLYLEEFNDIWKSIYDATNINNYEKKNPTTLVEILMDKIIWKHISPSLRVEGCFFNYNNLSQNNFYETIDISMTVTPRLYPDNFGKVQKWIKSLCIPFTLKQDMMKRLIKRRALDLFMILKNEMKSFGLIAKMPNIIQENIVIEQIIKGIVSNSSVAHLNSLKSYEINLEISKDNGFGDEEVGQYFYHFSEIKIGEQPITLYHVMAIDENI